MSSNNPNEVQDDQEEARIPVPVGSQHSPVNAELPSLASGEFWHSGTRGNLRQASSAECQRLLQRTDEAAKQSAAAQEEQIEKLAEQGRKKDDKLKELENNAEALKTQLQEQTNDAKKAKDELQKSLKSAAARATEATTAVAELQAKLQTVEKEHKKEIEDAKEALAAEKQNSEREKMELKKLTEELQRMNLENKELKNRVASENSRATGAVQEAQVLQEKLQQALKALDEKTTKLTTQENAHKLRMDQFEDDTKKRHKKEIKALEVEVKKRNATIKEHQVAAQERRAKHDAEVEELEQKLATEEEKCRRIVQDIREKLDAQFPPISRSPSTECVWPEMIIDDVFWQQPSSSTSHVYSSFAFSTPRSSSQNAPVQEEATSHQSTSSEPASSAPNSNSSPNSSARITRRHAPPSTSRASKRIAAKNAQEEPTKKPK